MGDATREFLRRLKRRRLFSYRPYPKQYEFHAAGKTNRERGMFAGNQEGKTFGASHELTMHLTGLYPDWWPGAVFDRPILAWTGSETNETSREIIQAALLGTESLALDDPDMGTGSIPGDNIVRITKRQAGVTDVADQIIVRHKSGGNSRVVLKCYEQGWKKFTGKKIDVWWPDEEPEQKIYSEGLTRTQAADGGLSMMTFTPLDGLSEVVTSFLSPEPGDAPKHVTNMTIFDCCGGVWPEGTPWAGEKWEGHYTKEKAEKIIAAWPAHERKTRAYGIPMMGEGMVWPVDEESYKIPPFEIPKHFPKLGAIDFGMDHPFGAAWIAIDRENDIVYVYDVYRISGAVPAIHAAAINARGTWIPMAWPHDGLNREKSSGRILKKSYTDHNVNMMFASARYKNDIGGRQDIEPGVVDIYERMLTGRFKVFSTCEPFFEEARMYHRKDGKIVPIKDDVISAVRYCCMEIRHAMLEFMPARRSRAQRGLRQVG